ncbi:hypothetical protein K2173_004341 [Erythroxylum novogranatense]|uniref:PIN-like protein n=1 Tax=Erythroxylum novogranatense TaxID=1862640 RepID=A0AAV8T5Q9_9ROSI|nr:hypothetical protein K2173_004341 [Erythroxylum novogranatense]
MIPCMLLALGGNLVDGPGSSKLGLRTTATIIFGRLVLVPLARLGIVTLADKLGFLAADDKDVSSLRLCVKHRVRRNCCLSVKFILDSAIIEQLGIPKSEIRNPMVSSSYRSSKLRKPNQTVLEAQARRELKDKEQVSKAQLGAFFSAMTIRANAFPEWIPH